MYLMFDFSDLLLNVWWYVEEGLKEQLMDQKKCYEWLVINGIFLLGEIDEYFQ